MLSVKALCHSYNGEPVLDHIGFHLEGGELCGLFGPNGSGKTTLFRCCLKLEQPDQGEIRLGGENINALSVRRMARQVAYVPQERAVAFGYPVGEMVLMGRTPHMGGFFHPGQRDRNRAEAALEMVGLSHLWHRFYDCLSGGQQQLVLIARAIAQETEIIFLDEPTSALDFKNQVVLWKILRRIADQGMTVLACSHDPNHVAWFCDTAVVLGPDGLAARGRPDDIMTQELMDRIYEGTCQMRTLDQTPIVLPKGVGRWGRNALFTPYPKQKENRI
ncbi:MAG: ABC transporter ATP-binding protein [Desulfobacterales bacterium]|nr:ABC transporter ATP-binding protein [Desulfobacterales bacterium]